jgi:hypothetical protein
MKRFTMSIGLLIILSIQSQCQILIDVVESTIKVPGMGEEIFYYGFAEGDQLVFNFQEVNGKELKEVEITELPASPKFMEYKAARIVNKNLSIPRKSIYKFRFANGALGGRVCKIRVQRIPGNERTKNFNTTVYWKTLYDTTFIPREERFLESSDTLVASVTDQLAKVSSQTAVNGNRNRNIVDFSLPDGTISWSYYIGVGQEGREAYDAAKSNFISNAAASVSTIPGYGPMAALALTGLNVFGKIQGRDNVKYFFITDWDNVQLFNSGQTFLQYKQGDVVNDASQMKYPLAGKVYLALSNDNVMEPIDVIVKVTAIQVLQKWGSRMIKEMHITARNEAFLID